MVNRIKLVQKSSKLNQDEFAERLGISRSALQKYFAGANNPSEQTIRAICTQFNIRREWLETGEGPMNPPEAEDDLLIDEIMAQHSDFVRAAFKAITRTPGGWEMLEQLAKNLAEDMQTKKDPVE